MDEARKAAEQRVRKLRGFYSHLATYIVINGFLLLVNLLTTPGTLWFYWVSLAWGLGLVFDAYETFFRRRFFGREWEERKVQEYMRKHPEDRPDLEEKKQDEERKSA